MPAQNQDVDAEQAFLNMVVNKNFATIFDMVCLSIE
jgi:hypothetical protein